jgi:hypothetical protein
MIGQQTGDLPQSARLIFNGYAQLSAKFGFHMRLSKLTQPSEALNFLCSWADLSPCTCPVAT